MRSSRVRLGMRSSWVVEYGSGWDLAEYGSGWDLAEYGSGWDLAELLHGLRDPMPTSQLSWVWSQHPPRQWNLRGGSNSDPIWASFYVLLICRLSEFRGLGDAGIWSWDHWLVTYHFLALTTVGCVPYCTRPHFRLFYSLRQWSGPMTYWCGSCYFRLKIHLQHFSKIKSPKEVTK